MTWDAPPEAIQDGGTQGRLPTSVIVRAVLAMGFCRLGCLHRQCWDLEGFTTGPQVQVPVRVVRSHETRLVRRQLDGPVEPEISQGYWGTTLPAPLAPAAPAPPRPCAEPAPTAHPDLIPPPKRRTSSLAGLVDTRDRTRIVYGTGFLAWIGLMLFLLRLGASTTSTRCRDAVRTPSPTGTRSTTSWGTCLRASGAASFAG